MMGWLRDRLEKREAEQKKYDARLDRFDEMSERTVRGNEMLLAARAQQHVLLERIACALEKLADK